MALLAPMPIASTITATAVKRGPAGVRVPRNEGPARTSSWTIGRSGRGGVSQGALDSAGHCLCRRFGARR